MRSDDVSATVTQMREEAVEDMVQRAIPEGAYHEQWDLDGLHTQVLGTFGLDLPIKDWAAEEGIADQEIYERIKDAVDKRMAEKTANYGPEIMRIAEKSILLQVLDQQWKEHLLQLDHMRQSINLRAYGQKDPLIEYKREAFALFDEMLSGLREQTVGLLSHMEIQLDDEHPDALAMPHQQQEMHAMHMDPSMAATGTDGFGFGYGDVPDFGPGGGEEDDDRPAIAPVRTRQASANLDPNDPSTWGKVQRNAPCPCGSGKKYKHCHGRM